MKYLFGLLFLIGNSELLSQEISKQIEDGQKLTFNSCNLAPFVIDDGKLGLAFKYKGGLSRYFNKALQFQKTQISGKIFLQLLIDKNGKACCRSVFSTTGMTINQLNSLKLDSIISRMPKWIPGKMDDENWNVSVMLLLKKEKNELDNIRIEYVYFK